MSGSEKEMRQLPQTLDGLIRHFVHLATHGVMAMEFEEYVERFRNRYHALVPRRRLINLPIDTGYESRRKATKKMTPYFGPDPKLRIPAQPVPAFIDALPEPYQSQCRTAAVRLINPEPVVAVDEEAAALALAGGSAKEHGEALQAFLALAKGGVNEHDSVEDLEYAALQIAQAQEKLGQQQAVVQGALQKKAEDRPLMAGGDS